MGCRFGPIACAAALLTACAGTVTQAPPLDRAEPESVTCETAYARLVRLECPEAEGVATMSWLEFCRIAEKSEGAIWLATACISRAATVEDVRKCRVRCLR